MISMGTVWERTAEFLSDNLGTILPIALLAIFVPAVIGGSFSGLQQDATPGLAVGLGLGSLLLALVGFWGQLAITALAIDPAIEGGAAKVATRRLPAALLVMIVAVLALLLALIPVAVILGATGVPIAAMSSQQMPDVPPGVAAGLLLYVLLLLPLLFWATTRLSVVLPVIVGERLALRAIPRAWRLTRGVALKIAGVLILYAVVSTVANLAATTAFGAIMYLVAGRGEDGLSLATILTSIVGGAVTTGFTVLGIAFITKLFVSLLAREQTAAAR